jgi:hypothetical protein
MYARPAGSMVPTLRPQMRSAVWLSPPLVADGGEDFETVPNRYRPNLGLEAVAKSINAYDPETRACSSPDFGVYVRAIPGGLPGADESAVERVVTLGIEQQDALMKRASPPRLTAVLGEGTLARRVGRSAIMAEQMYRLQELAQQRTHIDIRVLPVASRRPFGHPWRRVYYSRLCGGRRSRCGSLRWSHGRPIPGTLTRTR